MENFEDDDDTHFCNKCHSTINGLDNYVRHRQSGCRNTEEHDKTVYHCPPTASVSYPEILNADAFFSSLELQSSAKSLARRSTNHLLDERSRRCSRRSTRRRKDKSPDDKDESKEPSLLPVEATELDEIGLPSLVGFPEIVSKPPTTGATPKQTGSATATTSSIPKLEPVKSKRLQDDGQHSQPEQPHHHHSVWLGETLYNDLEVAHETKEMRHLEERYPEYDYQPDEEEDESDDDSSNVDMAELFSDSEDPDAQDAEVNDQQYPPQSHTGGKWRPGAIGQQDVQMHEEEPEMEAAEQHHEHPPPTYTGGKWKPADSGVQKHNEYDSSKESVAQPPPSHTRGKWVPGAQADVGTGYWCSPCGRKLASRLVYNRHLQSDLHARRSIQEIDGVVQIVAPRLRQQNLSRRQKALASKKSHDVLSSQTTSTSSQLSLKLSSCTRVKRLQSQNPLRSIATSSQENQTQQQRRRRREKEVLTCEMCRARVRRAQMGKHLLSHYHYRVAGAMTTPPRSGSGAGAATSTVTLERHREFLLKNMANIVRQSPFQCAPCRFYCNTEDTFLRHWRSETHVSTVAKIGGSFICALCDFWCDDNESVEAHIMKQGHQDVVSMINGSVPMVIRRQQILTCSTCCKRFRYNIQLRFHAKETGHKVDSSASDEYQSRLNCDQCGQVVRSLLALQRHRLACHKDEAASSIGPYFCSFCELNFVSAEEAVRHRRTSEHKKRVRNKKTNVETTRAADTDGNGRRNCQYCQESQENIIEHKQHLLLKHPEMCHRCGKCGKQFALSQDIARHSREKRCTPVDKCPPPESTNSKARHRCPICPFSSESQAECLFHEALHGEPAVELGSRVQDRTKYRCPLCERSFNRSSLREHLRGHTGERPLGCPNCGAAFARRADLRSHRARCEVAGANDACRVNAGVRQRKYICDVCENGFFTKHILRQHILRHAGKEYKCGLPGCPTILRTENELNIHRKLVHETSNVNRVFKCDDCSYAAKTKVQLIRHRQTHGDTTTEDSIHLYSCQFKGCNFQTKVGSHLKRHFRLHTGKKPYKCRHCTYASNNVENLRKHILSTNKHPGKMIYQCESCRNGNPFQTNFTKELRAHLLQFHPDEYPTPNDANNYTASIFAESK